MRSPSLFLLALALPLAGAAASASGETITVTTLEDVRDFGGAQRVANLPGPDGLVSFGEAVEAANNEPGPQRIHFAIPTSQYWLDPSIALLKLEIGPFILRGDATTIDFRTQTDFAGDTNPVGWEVGIFGLEPNGWGVAAILLAANDCTLIGLDNVYQRGAAVEISGNRNRIFGFTTDGPLGSAIAIEGTFGGASADDNVIGGVAPGEGNVVSGGGYGITITGPANRNVVIGNTCLESPNGGIGVFAATRYGVVASDNRIGGLNLGEGNWVAGNGKWGEEGFPVGNEIRVDDADRTVVEGNVVGTTADGLADYPVQKGPGGIVVNSSRDTLVRANLVSGILQIGTNHYQGQRFGVGIAVQGVSVNTRVVGNKVGVDATGANPIPNVNGIVVTQLTTRETPTRTRIGALAAGQGNVVAYNERTGVRVDAFAASTSVRGNSIHDNGDLGIDLVEFTGPGPTPNDPLDADTEGGNSLQNFPVIAKAASRDGLTGAKGRLESTPNTLFKIDFYASPACDPSGYGEGAEIVDSISVTTDSSGVATFRRAFRRTAPSGWVVTATATNVGTMETSEFSPCATIR